MLPGTEQSFQLALLSAVSREGFDDAAARFTAKHSDAKLRLYKTAAPQSTEPSFFIYHPFDNLGIRLY